MDAQNDATAPETLVRRFLTAMEARDLTVARACLDDRFVMYFPGTGPIHDLETLIEWSRPRYAFVKKTYDGFDVSDGIVYCRGTLSGEWPDGAPFDGIRFIDRFEIEGERIVRQDVWNDMAEVRAR
ncbi:nuclear transport factor 2 family protein [Oceaniglobus indicus]|uniref:nuclear transport factor 2 family protein n=1 Tax=Oceaniglobus indicus TaxID=2047749 RepID=UPI000C1A16AA|nr:nuclear transport factor 2 family protein [Oceaniglobus indicus]